MAAFCALVVRVVIGGRSHHGTGPRARLMSSFGPVNASMGGASTAAPIEAMSAMGWNPATISGLPNSELSVGLGLLLSDPVLESSVPGWSSGVTGAEPGTTPIPNFAWVHKLNDFTTFGLGALSVAGFKANYPADPTNPVLAPVSNTPGVPGGLGKPVFRSAVPANRPRCVLRRDRSHVDRVRADAHDRSGRGRSAVVSCRRTTRMGVAFRGIPAGRGTRYSWGGGAQLGVYYITENFWHFGASIKSPQWMEAIVCTPSANSGCPTWPRSSSTCR